MVFAMSKSPAESENYLPQHVAIIMDGNGRWAQSRGYPRIEGHRRGAKVIRKVMQACRELQIPYLTLYCFSSENWKRPKTELSFLMDLLESYLVRERKEFIKNKVRLNILGVRDGLPDNVLKQMDASVASCPEDFEFTLSLALNYGSRDEITAACKKLAKRVLEGEIALDEITQESISNSLFTHDLPDPDLLIRTSGEMRISNFLLWQISYTEIWITEKHWPEFDGADLMEAVQSYSKRHRRFGGLQ